MNDNLQPILELIVSTIVIIHALYYINLVLKLGSIASAWNVLKSAVVWSVLTCGYVAMAFYAFVGA